MMGKPVSRARRQLSLKAFGLGAGALATCSVSPKMGLRGGMQPSETEMVQTVSNPLATGSEHCDAPTAGDDGVEEMKTENVDPAKW